MQFLLHDGLSVCHTSELLILYIILINKSIRSGNESIPVIDEFTSTMMSFSYEATFLIITVNLSTEQDT